jgi:polar amino acid transport system substrate-binding protein
MARGWSAGLQPPLGSVSGRRITATNGATPTSTLEEHAMNNRALGFNRRYAVASLAVLFAALTLGPVPASAITPEEIKAKGKLVVGIQAANPPWGYVDSATGNADGIDADIAKLFGKELGVPVQFVGLEVANRIPALTSGRVDVLFATMAMLPDRAKAVQYSKPYVANSTYLVAPKTTDIKTNADMAKFVIGVPRASSMDTDVAKSAPASTTVRRFDNDAANIQALLSGQVQAVGGNVFYVKRLNEAAPDKYENKLEFTKLYNGACTRLGEKEINAALNAFIDKISANGELAKVQEKWMGSSMTKFPSRLEGVPFVAN